MFEPRIPPPLRLPPPPRVVTHGPGASVWIGRFFVLPHTLVGLGAIVMLALKLILVLFGTDVDGEVQGGSIGSGKHGPTYSVDYSYQVDGRALTGSDSVDARQYQSLTGRTKGKAATVRLRHVEIGPIHQAGLASEAGSFGEVAVIFVFAAFWNSIMGVILWLLWVVPYRMKKLYQLGESTRGTVTGTRTVQRKTVTHYVAYRFTTDRGEEIEGEMSTSGHDRSLATEGRPVTVLYWPEQPRTNVVYEFGTYGVDPSNGGALLPR